MRGAAPAFPEPHLLARLAAKFPGDAIAVKFGYHSLPTVLAFADDMTTVASTACFD
jgi:hypothetical protein